MKYFLGFIAVCLIIVLTITCLSSNKSKEEVVENKSKSITNQKVSIGYLNLVITDELIRRFKTRKDGNKMGCDDWELTTIDLKNILKNMTKVESTEWYAKCYNLPCWYETTVSNGKVKYEMVISAGSYISLSNKKETLLFIMDNKSKLFLEPCDCCE